MLNMKFCGVITLARLASSLLYLQAFNSTRSQGRILHSYFLDLLSLKQQVFYFLLDFTYLVCIQISASNQ